jgi:hypothetical protein
VQAAAIRGESEEEIRAIIVAMENRRRMIRAEYIPVLEFSARETAYEGH